MSKFSVVSACSSKLHLVNGAQFFKANLVSALTALAALTGFGTLVSYLIVSGLFALDYLL